MKQENGYWIDENNNRWSVNLETKGSAEKKSKTLTYCSDCVNCYSCNYCNFCNSCYSCNSCNSCDSCDYCNYCKSCNSCNGFKSNPQRYLTPKVGSRNSQTSIYWTTKDDVQIICGCWKGNIEQFESRVKEVHGDNEHGKAYQKQIEIFKMLVKTQDR